MGWEGPGRPCTFSPDHLSTWEGSSHRTMSRHGPRACWESEPGNSGSGGCALVVNPRARRSELRHQGILNFISLSACHSGSEVIRHLENSMTRPRLDEGGSFYRPGR